MKKSAFLAVLALTLLSTLSVHAAEKLRLERIDFKESPTIVTYLTVTDSDGRVIAGKLREDLKLQYDSAEQGPGTQMQSFDQKGEPVSIVALVQVSQAMLDVSEDVKKGVKLVADALPQKSRMALVGFSSDAKRLADLGPPVEAEGAANSLVTDTEYVEVHLLDALRSAIEMLNSAPEGSRKMIVLFSDGIDVNMEKKSFFSVGKRASDAGIVIDTIGYAPFEPARLRNLTELTKQTSGGERTCKTSGELVQAFNDVADEVHKQYVVTYELAVPGGDPKLHSFQILLDANGVSAGSNVLQHLVPKATHRVRKGGEHRWWLWAVCILGGVLVVMLVVWLIFREKDEAPMAFAPPSPQPQQGKPRTMAMDAPVQGGRVSAVGWLVATSGRQADKTFPLKSGQTVIGTAGDCDVVIEDGFASSRHAEVRLSGNAFRITDLGSTNGLVVNGKKVRDHELVDNDRIVIGKTELKFKSVVQ